MYTKINRSIPLTEEQIQIIIGTTLGDASLTKSRYDKPTACIRFCHSIIQKEYAWYKYKFLKSISKKEPIERTSWIKSRQKYYTKIDYSSVYSKELYDLHLLFYSKLGKKFIPQNIEQFLTPLSLSIWYMDDGSIETIRDKRNGKIHHIRNQINLHTNGFTKGDCLVLLKAIENIFDLKFRLKRVEKGRHYILICRNRKHIEKFFSIIKPHMHPTMFYKTKTSYIKDMKKPKYNKHKIIYVMKKLNLKRHTDFIRYRHGKRLYDTVRYYFGSLKHALTCL